MSVIFFLTILANRVFACFCEGVLRFNHVLRTAFFRLLMLFFSFIERFESFTR